MILVSIFCAFLTGKVNSLSNAIISGTSESVKFIISIIGMMAFWTGIMKIAEKSGITNFLSKCLSPIIKLTILIILIIMLVAIILTYFQKKSKVFL